MWSKDKIRWDNKEIQVKTTGNGAQLLLAMHGFSKDSSLYEFLSILRHQYTIVAVDLPFHGGSHWEEELLFTNEDLQKFTAAVLVRYNRNTLSLCGYSIGGRFALKIAELLPENVSRMVLIAPDGLFSNPFYYFVTQTIVGKSIFSFFLHRPQLLVRLVSLLNKLGIVKTPLSTFLNQKLCNSAYCMQVKNTWLSTRYILPDMPKLQEIVHKFEIDTRLLMGKKDALIPLKPAIQFADNSPNIKLQVLNKGHWLFDQESTEHILNMLRL